MTSFTIPIVQTDDCDDLPAPQRVPDPIPFPRPPFVVSHVDIHQVPQPDCEMCPKTPCPCGALDCPLVSEHLAAYRCAEVTLLERCA